MHFESTVGCFPSWRKSGLLFMSKAIFLFIPFNFLQSYGVTIDGRPIESRFNAKNSVSFTTNGTPGRPLRATDNYQYRTVGNNNFNPTNKNTTYQNSYSTGGFKSRSGSLPRSLSTPADYQQVRSGICYIQVLYSKDILQHNG